jgi:hypothetical protein
VSSPRSAPAPGSAASRPAGDSDEETLNSQNHFEACVRTESSQVYLLVLPETFLENCYVQFCSRLMTRVVEAATARENEDLRMD